MNTRLYKHTNISLLVIYGWTLYGFFEYFKETGFMKGVDVFVFYLMSLYCALLLGTIVLLIRAFLFRGTKAERLRQNFVYLFTGIFNLHLFIVWAISIILRILFLDMGVLSYLALGGLVISVVILNDIFHIGHKLRKMLYWLRSIKGRDRPQ